MYHEEIHKAYCNYAVPTNITCTGAAREHVLPLEGRILQLVAVQGARDVDVFGADANNMPVATFVEETVLNHFRFKRRQLRALLSVQQLLCQHRCQASALFLFLTASLPPPPAS